MFKWREGQQEAIHHTNIKRAITSSFARSLKVLQQKHLQCKEEEFVYSNDGSNNLCSSLESAFLHGLKDSVAHKLTAYVGLTSAPDQTTSMNFWSVVLKFTHSDVVTQLQKLTQITTEIGLCRAWVRLALNDGLMESYLHSMIVDIKTLKYFYHSYSYLRDHEQPGILKNYLTGLMSLEFKLSYNSSVLNQWSNTTLQLTGTLDPHFTPAPTIVHAGIVSAGSDVRHEKSSQGNNAASAATKHVEIVSEVGNPLVVVDDLHKTSVDRDDHSSYPSLLVSGGSSNSRVSCSDQVVETSNEDKVVQQETKHHVDKVPDFHDHYRERASLASTESFDLDKAESCLSDNKAECQLKPHVILVEAKQLDPPASPSRPRSRRVGDEDIQYLCSSSLPPPSISSGNNSTQHCHNVHSDKNKDYAYTPSTSFHGNTLLHSAVSRKLDTPQERSDGLSHAAEDSPVFHSIYHEAETSESFGNKAKSSNCNYNEISSTETSDKCDQKELSRKTLCEEIRPAGQQITNRDSLNKVVTSDIITLTAGDKIFKSSKQSLDQLQEHSITAGEHSITAGEHSITAGEHSITAGEHSITAGEHSLTVGEHSLTVGEHSLTAGEHSITAGEHSLTVGEHSLSTECSSSAQHSSEKSYDSLLTPTTKGREPVSHVATEGTHLYHTANGHDGYGSAGPIIDRRQQHCLNSVHHHSTKIEQDSQAIQHVQVTSSRARHSNESTRQDTDLQEAFEAETEMSMSPSRFGNSLSSMSGWSSDIESKKERRKQSGIERSRGESFATMLRGYMPTSSQQSQSVTLNDVIDDLPCHSDEDSLDGSQQSDEVSQSQDVQLEDSGLDNFEVLKSPSEFFCGLVEANSSRMYFLFHVPREHGLSHQNFACKGCSRPIGIIYGAPRLCEFDGGLYCFGCHENNETYIPSSILYDWDFRKKKVSQDNYKFLQELEEQALYNVEELSPKLYSHVPELQDLKMLRQQLVYLKSYLFACSQKVAESMRQKVWPREHLYDSRDLYSVMDFLQVLNGSLQKLLKDLVKFSSQHVYDCVLCSLKGFVCEICRNAHVIYPFEVDTTVRCTTCKAVYHKTCMTESLPCPKCERWGRHPSSRNISDCHPEDYGMSPHV